MTKEQAISRKDYQLLFYALLDELQELAHNSRMKAASRRPYTGRTPGIPVATILELHATYSEASTSIINSYTETTAL